MALWGGRFEAGVAEVTQEFGASLPVDKHLYKQDIAGSKAHAKMLAAQGIISAEDEQAIAKGLTGIEQDIDAGNFTFDINDEDIHMSIESELTRRIGEAGKRLHTGRSRNDQVATDTRLGVKALAKELMEANLELRHVLVDAAKKYDKVILPGYTHMQHAQPVLLSHHLLAYSWMFARDFTRLKAAFDAADNCPLGAAALAGTSYPLDRQMTAAELGFAGVIPNSLDAVSDRDFLLDLHYAGSVMAMHLSRLSEEIVLWSSSEFGFITLSDSYSTGSSIMPQKKNPDFAELTRGKMGRVVGDLVALLVTMKSLPLAYNKDTLERAITEPDFLIQLATTLKEEKAKRLEAEQQCEAQKQIIGEMEKKVSYLDLILSSTSTMTITQIAQDYGMSGQRMNKLLHGLRIQYKVGEQWILYAEYKDKCYVSSETIHFMTNEGVPCTTLNTKWTQKGRLFLYDILKKEGILPQMEWAKKAARDKNTPNETRNCNDLE